MKNKGITIISLTITIIILIILAGVGIQALTNTGLFEKAKLAKAKQNEVEIEENEKLTDYNNKITEYLSGNYRDGNIKFENCTITISNYGEISINGIENLESFFIIQDNKYLDVAETSTYNLNVSIGEKHDYYVIAIDTDSNLYKSNTVSYDSSYSSTGETADEIIERLGEEIRTSMAGKEVKYVSYKDKDGNEQDKWIIVYIGKNKDTSNDIIDDMPTNENHIYLLPKYSVAYISPANSTLELENSKKYVEAKINANNGYASTVAFKDAMRNSNIWSNYSKGNGTTTHGAMSIAQYNMCLEWGSKDSLSNGTYYWLDDPTWVNAIARADADGTRSGNGLAYWTDQLCIRPFVMLGTNCKLTTENRILY